MRGNTHVRFGGAGRGSEVPERPTPHPGPIPADGAGTAVDLHADHRAHAVVELAIRDFKEGAGLDHCPSGRFHANGAWAVLASVAHNLLR